MCFAWNKALNTLKLGTRSDDSLYLLLAAALWIKQTSLGGKAKWRMLLLSEKQHVLLRKEFRRIQQGGKEKKGWRAGSSQQSAA